MYVVCDVQNLSGCKQICKLVISNKGFTYVIALVKKFVIVIYTALVRTTQLVVCNPPVHLHARALVDYNPLIV